MPQAFVVKDHRVDEELFPEVLARLLLEGFAVGTAAAAAAAQRVRPPRVRGEISAGMRRADLESGESIEGALEDQVREKHCRFERVANRVAQQPLALESHVLRR